MIQPRGRFREERVNGQWLTNSVFANEDQSIDLIRGMQSALLLLGRRQLGEPDRAAVAELETITDAHQLDRLGDGLAEAASWQELLRTL